MIFCMRVSCRSVAILIFAYVLGIASAELNSPGGSQKPRTLTPAEIDAIDTSGANDPQSDHGLELMRQAQAGDPDAEFAVGAKFYLSAANAVDFTNATIWFRRAAEHGQAKAQFRLGECFLKGLGVSQDSSLAVEWTRKAADQGLSNAQFIMGTFYQSGTGVEKSVAGAAEWYRKAAEHGQASAQEQLGRMYLSGAGVPRNDIQGVQLLRLAAEQGSPGAQRLLGLCYIDGQGVTKDYSEAFTWLKKAAGQGDHAAQYNLGICFYRGTGTPRDYIQAYEWLNLAAAGGNDAARQPLAEIEGLMTSAQVEEAQRRSSLFVRQKQINPSGGLDSSKDTLPAGPLDPEAKSVGTAFMVSDDGYLLTAYHVVKSASALRVFLNGKSYPAHVVKADIPDDTAVIKIEGRFSALPLAPSRNVRLGDPVFTVGFPNPELQGVEVKLTRGEVSALNGFQDEPRHFQISVPVQPGNSGGALIDSFGNVIGIVTGRLADVATFQSTGSLPQNVNYAIKSAFIRPFLETIPDLEKGLKPSHDATHGVFDKIVGESQKATGLVIAY